MSPEDVDVIKAVLPVAGTLAGVVVGVLGTYVLERAKRNHEDRHRFDPDKKSLYVRITHQIGRAGESHRLLRVAVQDAEGKDLPDGLTDSIGEQVHEWIELMATARVIASIPVIKGIRDTIDSQKSILELLIAEKTSGSAWDAAEKARRRGLAELTHAIRTDLRVDHGVPLRARLVHWIGRPMRWARARMRRRN